MLESANTTRAKTTRVRRIKMPDGKVRYSSTDAKEIAAELRAKSLLGERERKVREAEAKLGR